MQDFRKSTTVRRRVQVTRGGMTYTARTFTRDGWLIVPNFPAGFEQPFRWRRGR
jgi:hypothetical protein